MKNVDTNPSASSIPKNIDSKDDILSSILSFSKQIGSETCVQLIEIFIQELKTKIPQLKNLYLDENYQEIESHVHQLKSNSRYFGFELFANTCEELEFSVSNAQFSKMEGLIYDLEGALKIVIENANSACAHLSSMAGAA